MENRIELSFKNTISRLAGNSFGKDIYEKQAKDKIDFDGVNIIVIPDTIEDIAISFVQGFISEILEKCDLNSFSEHFKIEGNKKVVEKFKKSIYF
ncbi:hypothetical protein LIZ77_05460 [Clostridium perfringens]|uniref:hypothetical protein n=1 Tax=Clostridium perfringens TaxID=1502 RepID=UPI0022481220|nr:hypothetical protein [Clostridium perfringens]MCX0370217.1 hypothetical protein [Clostridium perfringens]